MHFSTQQCTFRTGVAAEGHFYSLVSRCQCSCQPFVIRLCFFLHRFDCPMSMPKPNSCPPFFDLVSVISYGPLKVVAKSRPVPR
uniref:Uncharacterized protein n=1 Tax=Arundo donax TaxID=35708 RepID=A0A0A9BHZ7_ARUDO